MRPRRLGDVLKAIEMLPMTGDDKVELLVGWARAVGVKVSASQRDRVARSGVDRRGLVYTAKSAEELERELASAGEAGSQPASLPTAAPAPAPAGLITPTAPAKP